MIPKFIKSLIFAVIAVLASATAFAELTTDGNQAQSSTGTYGNVVNVWFMSPSGSAKKAPTPLTGQSTYLNFTYGEAGTWTCYITAGPNLGQATTTVSGYITVVTPETWSWVNYDGAWGSESARIYDTPGWDPALHYKNESCNWHTEHTRTLYKHEVSSPSGFIRNDGTLRSPSSETATVNTGTVYGLITVETWSWVNYDGSWGSESARIYDTPGWDPAAHYTNESCNWHTEHTRTLYKHEVSSPSGFIRNDGTLRSPSSETATVNTGTIWGTKSLETWSWEYYTGSWSSWTPYWDTSTHYTNQSCDQSMSQPRYKREVSNLGNVRNSGTADSPANNYDYRTIWGTIPLTTSLNSATLTNFVYDGNSHSPTVSSTNPSGATTSISVTAQTEVGSYSATVTGTGSYTGSVYPSWSITQGSQSVTISPSSQSIVTGQQIAFTASGGNNGYNWTGSASGTGTTQTVTFPTAGTFTVSVQSPSSTNYAASNIATATITVSNPTSQTVTISPTSQTILAGQQITFTASGGQNGYNWTGAASGTGTTKPVTFATAGTFTVSVQSPAGGIYSASNIASATITVNPVTTPITAATLTSFVYDGNSHSPTVSSTTPNGATVSITVTPQTNVGTYTATVTGTGSYTGSVTPSWAITQAPQTVTISPSSQSIYAGQPITFTASGGQTGYNWTGAASGTGTSQTVTFPTAGTFTVSVQSPANANYTASNVATATITVTNLNPQTVTISPGSQTITAGQGIVFTAGGGQNGYNWTGSASGTGPNQTVNFPTAGTFTVSVQSPAGNGYSVSNIASSTITVNPPNYTLTTSVSGNGTVTAGGIYPANTWVTVTPYNSATARFNNWAGDVTGNNNPLMVQMTNNRNVIAVFIDKLAQTISFPNPGNQPNGAIVGLLATATSGLPISYAVITGPATLSGNQLTVNGNGTITVQATQSGNDTYLAAIPVSVTFTAYNPAKVKIKTNDSTTKVLDNTEQGVIVK